MDDMLYCPAPHTYVVAQLDVQATVQTLDAQAQEASRAIGPAKCILYLCDAPRLPLPGRPTTFETYIVGPSLRAEDSENCLTTNMCVPISPNTVHPDNRPPVRTKTPFPFSNCYHWAYLDLLLRVPCGEFPSVDDACLVRLVGSQQARLDRFLMEDLNTAILAKRQCQETSLQPDYDPEYDVFCHQSRVPEGLLPVVTISVDLAGSLVETSLPDPMEFLQQYNALVRLAKESNARREAVADDNSVRDNALSVSTACTENGQLDWTGESESEERRRSGRFRMFSKAAMRILRVGQSKKQDQVPHRELYGEEDDSLSRLFDEISEIACAGTKPKESNKLPIKMFHLIRTLFRPHQPIY